MKPCHKEIHDPSCPLCLLYENNESYRTHCEGSYENPTTQSNRVRYEFQRKDRCIYLGERIEFRKTCLSGMNCQHQCKKGLKAIPSMYCQSCESYQQYDRVNPLNPVPWVGDITDFASLDYSAVHKPTSNVLTGLLPEGTVAAPTLFGEGPVGRGDKGLRPVDLGEDDTTGQNHRTDQPQLDEPSHDPSPVGIPYSYSSTPNLTDTKIPALSYMYGVTTCPKRLADNTLRRTLESLKRAGFDRPHLFVDGDDDSKRYVNEFGLNVTCRYPAAKTAGNWVISLYELWARNSQADRYAIFQDDFVTYEGLREYLDSCVYPEKGYWNLYTFPVNQRLSPKTPAGGTVDGWFMANQMGKGAVALVFDAAAVRCLLGWEYLCDRFLTTDLVPGTQKRRCDQAIDGGIVESLKRKGWTEWCHSPSLVQHTGLESSMANRRHALAESFRGEGFDARSLIQQK